MPIFTFLFYLMEEELKIHGEFLSGIVLIERIGVGSFATVYKGQIVMVPSGIYF